MAEPNWLREKQAPIKQRFNDDPDSAWTTITVHSVTEGNSPLLSTVTADAIRGSRFDSSAHPNAGGDGDLCCSGDLLMAALAACQEITLRMVAAAMGIELQEVQISVEGDMDFRGTMGTDPDVPVGFQSIRTKVAIRADAPADRLERLWQRAEKYCVVSQTLRQLPVMESSFEALS